MTMDAVGEPILQSAESPGTEICIECVGAKILPRAIHELRRIEIAERIGRKIADASEAPVNVLQATAGVVGRREIEQLLESLAPSRRQIGRFQVAAHQRLFQFK